MTAGMRHQALLLAIAGVVLFAGLGSHQVWDVDEAIFAQTAWEMMDRGDLVVPYFNGTVFPDKPPLMYWGMIAAYKAFGPTEFAARFWSAVFGLGSVLLTYQLGRRLFSAGVGYWAGLILATSLNFDIIGRAATPDSMLVFFSTLALLILVRGSWQSTGDDTQTPLVLAPSWRTYALAYVAMGFGVLVKGPIGVVLPTAVWGLFLLFQNRIPLPASASWQLRVVLAPRVFAPANVARTIWQMRPLTALLAVCLVAGPWFTAVSLSTSGNWLAGFIGVHNVGRFLNAMDNHRGPIYYYLIALLVGFFPWSLFLVPSGLEVGRTLRARNSFSPGYVLACSWIVIWVGFFSLAKTKLPSYVVPAYPALALLMAGFVHSLLGRPAADRGWLRTAWGILGALGLAMVVGMPLASKRFFEVDPLIGLVGLVPLVGAAVCLWFSERGQPRRAMIVVAVTSVVLVLGLFNFAAQRIDRYQNSSMFVEAIRERTTSGQAHIGTYYYFRPSLVFYSKQPIEKFVTGQEVQDFFSANSRDAFLLTTDEQLAGIADSLPPDISVLETSRTFLKSTTVLLLGREAGANTGRQMLKDGQILRR